MPETPESSAVWDSLHAQERFRPRYPNEDVVRFLARRGGHQTTRPRALEIGVGAGRHCILLSSFGYDLDGVDISSEGLRHARELIEQSGETAQLQQASMSSLPFEDRTFDLALSIHVFYYGTAEQGRAAVAELLRVLKPGADAFVIVRSTRDYRCGRGTALGEETYCLEADDTNERGTVQHFLSEEAVEARFADFSEVHFELAETTFYERRARNSDWLISLRK